MNYIFNIMKDLIRTVFLTIAIYSGAVAANSDDVNIIGALLCGISCSVFVLMTDKKKD